MFEKIYGHSNQKKMLENILLEDKLSHAYLFFGPDGIGKKKMAIEFAKVILNTDNLDSCVDYKYITKLPEKKDILVSQVRESITEDVVERPILGQKKVYIIDEAHFLNDVAQNALLKTLEEPPSYIVIILIASTVSSFLPTILSRVNKIEFQGLKNEEMNSYIAQESINISDNILHFSQGSIGKLQYIISNNSLEKFNMVDELLNNMVNKNIALALQTSQEIDFSDNILLEYLEFILFTNRYFKACLEIKKAISRLKMNGNYDIVIDNMLLRCIESM